MNTFMFALQGQKHIAQGNTLGNCYAIMFCSPCKGKSVFTCAFITDACLFIICLTSADKIQSSEFKRNINVLYD